MICETLQLISLLVGVILDELLVEMILVALFKSRVAC